MNEFFYQFNNFTKSIHFVCDMTMTVDISDN